MNKMGIVFNRLKYTKKYFFDWLFNDPKKIPREIVFEITTRCNLNCSFCFNKLCISDRNSIKDMSYDSVIKLIDQISCTPIDRIRFTGGEPMLKKDIFKILRYAKSKGFTIWFNTNATLIKKSEAKMMSKYVDNVLISFNGHNKQDEKLTTGYDFFDKKIRGIEYLKSAGVKKVRLGTVALKKNINVLEAFHKSVKKLNVHGWELYRPIPVGENKLVTEDIKRLVEKLIKINRLNNTDYKIANAIPLCSYNPMKLNMVTEGAFCDDGHVRLVVDTRGFLKPSYPVTESVGEVTDNVMSIWNSGLMKKVRKLKQVPKICKRCKYLWKCKGGSRLAAKVINGDYEKMDYLAQPEKYARYLFPLNQKV